MLLREIEGMEDFANKLKKFAIDTPEKFYSMAISQPLVLCENLRIYEEELMEIIEVVKKYIPKDVLKKIDNKIIKRRTLGMVIPEREVRSNDEDQELEE